MTRQPTTAGVQRAAEKIAAILPPTPLLPLEIDGATPLRTSFPERLSGGSHHPDWYAAMLPDVVRCFEEPACARPLFDEAAETLSIISEGYAAAVASA